MLSYTLFEHSAGVHPCLWENTSPTESIQDYGTMSLLDVCVWIFWGLLLPDGVR